MKRLMLFPFLLAVPGYAQEMPAPKNQGTQVWLVPPPAGDLIRAVQHPELWAKARGRVDVFGFFMIDGYDDPTFQCGNPCGPNTYKALMAAVPGGAFKWIQDQGMLLGMEAPAIKEMTCTRELVLSQAVPPVITSLDNITAGGATMTYLAMDEPFASGVGSYRPREIWGCHLARGEVAQMVKLYIDTIHQRYPSIQIGLTEPYPFQSVDEIMSDILELEHAGVVIPFFRLDFDVQRTVREGDDPFSDIPRIREFCRARGIPFGTIIYGANGTSNAAYATDSWTDVRTIYKAVGVTEITTFESWAEDPPGDMRSLKHAPDIVPESDPMTFAGQLLGQLAYMHVLPAR